MAHQISHIIEYRNSNMQRAIMQTYMANLPLREENAKIAEIEKSAGYKHGWFFDDMSGMTIKNDGGKNIVWVDQPYMD